jgi:hypothetical protein
MLSHFFPFCEASCRLTGENKPAILRPAVESEQGENQAPSHSHRSVPWSCAKVAGSSSDTQNTCGEGSAGWGRVAPVELPSVKQEPNAVSSSGEMGKFWRTELGVSHQVPQGGSRGLCGAIHARPDLTRFGQGKVTSYRAMFTGSVHVPTLGWHFSLNRSSPIERQATRFEPVCSGKVLPVNLVEGHLGGAGVAGSHPKTGPHTGYQFSSTKGEVALPPLSVHN